MPAEANKGRLKLVGAQQPRADTVAERVRRLQNEARALAMGQVESFRDQIQSLADLAEEIADGGDVYPVGAREVARRLAEDLVSKAQTLQVIVNKA